MSKPNVITILSLTVLFALVSIAYGGGWATVTLNDFPDFAVAGKTLNLSFIVRQHGVSPLDGLKPTLNATNANGREVKASVLAGKTRGEYTVALKLPEAGEWTIAINNGFNGVVTAMPALKVINAGASQPAAYSPSTRGLRLFTAKGCVGCHRHIEVNPDRQTDARFDLSTRRFDHEYLISFLTDPAVKTKDMPNLKLSKEEVESLAAFINKTAVKKQAALEASR